MLKRIFLSNGFILKTVTHVFFQQHAFVDIRTYITQFRKVSEICDVQCSGNAENMSPISSNSSLTLSTNPPLIFLPSIFELSLFFLPSRFSVSPERTPPLQTHMDGVSTLSIEGWSLDDDRRTNQPTEYPKWVRYHRYAWPFLRPVLRIDARRLSEGKTGSDLSEIWVSINTYMTASPLFIHLYRPKPLLKRKWAKQREIERWGEMWESARKGHQSLVLSSESAIQHFHISSGDSGTICFNFSSREEAIHPPWYEECTYWTCRNCDRKSMPYRQWAACKMYCISECNNR